MHYEAWLQVQSYLSLMNHQCSQLSVLDNDQNSFMEKRKVLCCQLTRMQSKLRECIHEKEVKWATLALVLYTDEVILNSVFTSNPQRWPLLQKELFFMSNGGDIFYSSLDYVMTHQRELPFALEVFYFCLKLGFVGRYQNKKSEINTYLKRIESIYRQDWKPKMPSVDLHLSSLLQPTEDMPTAVSH